MLFGAIIIPADVLIVYPADINVPLPAALLFYPVIGFFAEIVFHLLPLTLLLFAMNAVFPTANREHLIWVAIIVVALVEPVYQTSLMMSPGRYSLAALSFNALHVFAINVSGLVLFRRFDFVTMYAMRLAYYLIWHIAWGYARLSILF